MSTLSNKDSIFIKMVFTDDFNIQVTQKNLILSKRKNTSFQIFPALFRKKIIIVLNFKIKSSARWMSGELVFSLDNFSGVAKKFTNSRNFLTINNFIAGIVKEEIRDTFLPPF